ncbi:MAG: 2-phospho-L-lactate transferase [archaeon]|nr:2-phospho-L-lactate transferase [archaeon]MCP8314884.1 2-phospho-L-lactate transferase [archaeon]MCP8315346.1 2-phospho-L-lactate transferase [archaeon]MCP8321480.1 2-phospho-L-lactate transferase [archaeon]
MITALAGGVGAARFLEGLIKVVEDEEISVIVNTGDDIELYGLQISPDIDTIIYTLVGIVDIEKGWGIKGDTFHCLEALKRYGYDTWFMLGDRDLATHIHRTLLLKKGLKLSEVIDKERIALGVKARIIPMTDDRVETIMITDKGDMHFQEYLVKRKAQDEVLKIMFKGIEEARPAPGVIDSIREARGIIVCPSNPIVSIGTILSVPRVRESLKETKAKIVGISPLIAGAPVKGPADKLMNSMAVQLCIKKEEVSAYGVAKLYRDFLDAFVIDNLDASLKGKIEALGMRVFVTDTIMRGLKEKMELAKVALNAMGV